LDGERPDSLRGGDSNLYGYVFNDPVNLTDRTGNDAWMNNSDNIFRNWEGQPPGQWYYPSPPKNPNPFPWPPPKPKPPAPKPDPKKPIKCPVDDYDTARRKELAK
jgi:hypothetical protein